jgi:signal transduction histidine kinase/CheY-like chemotaxis protein
MCSTRKERHRALPCWQVSHPKAAITSAIRSGSGRASSANARWKNPRSCSTICRVTSGLGGASPRSLLVLPLIFEGQVKGVLELASFEGFNPSHQALLDQLTESIGIVLHTIEANMRTEGLLKQSQSLAQQLQTRQEELQQTNEELKEKAHLLAQQNQEVELKNQEVEQARQELEDKAKQLALTSKYKSEFLANMSHELRTPLNSLLILSDQLTKNTEGNLTDKQTECAKTIHSSGNDLLMLINDILDLSKIESGTVMVEISEVLLNDLHGYVARTFTHVAEAKSVEFSIRFDERLPRSVYTDAKRLQQIIKNLLSNAFKFTHYGQVTLTIEPADDKMLGDRDELNRAAPVIAFTVSDTGIGIAPDKQRIIFEAFQQADGSTSRKYGGTGLGLAISRELSRLLGGEIRLVSSPGHGSTFTLFLPAKYVPRQARKVTGAQEITYQPDVARPLDKFKPEIHSNEEHAAEAEASVGRLVNEIGDDRDDIQPGDNVLLIIENDLGFARFLLDMARNKGYKGLVTSLGAAALALTQDYKPAAVLLDIHLPDMVGWRVLERLKNDLVTRHIPVAVISTDESRDLALNSGAWAFVAKPIQNSDTLSTLLTNLLDFKKRQEKRILLVEPNAKIRSRLTKLLSVKDNHIHAAADVPAAHKIMRKQPIDCLIVSSNAADILDEIRPAGGNDDIIANRTPIIVFGEGEADQEAWSRVQDNYVLYRARSTDQLLDTVSLCLHRDVATLPDGCR